PGAAGAPPPARPPVDAEDPAGLHAAESLSPALKVEAPFLGQGTASLVDRAVPDLDVVQRAPRAGVLRRPIEAKSALVGPQPRGHRKGALPGRAAVQEGGRDPSRRGVTAPGAWTSSGHRWAGRSRRPAPR